jgi:hypothetical protein
MAFVTPDPGDGLRRLEAMISQDLHRKIDPASRAAIVGWGLFFNVVYQITAILHLHKRECCFAAAPNRRTAIEYTLYLVWLANEGDHVVDVLNRGLQQSQVQMERRLRADNAIASFPQEALHTLADTIAMELPAESDETLLRVSHLLDEYGYGGLKPYYRAESRFIHVSLTAVRAFARDSVDGLLRGQRSIDGEVMPCQQFCLPVLFDAMLAFNSLLVDSPWTKPLTQIGADYELPTVLRSRNNGLNDEARKTDAR